MQVTTIFMIDTVSPTELEKSKQLLSSPLVQIRKKLLTGLRPYLAKTKISDVELASRWVVVY